MAPRRGTRSRSRRCSARYRQPISGYVRARVRDEGRTEDLVQEIFFSAHNSLATLSDPRAFRTWLYQIAHNACLDEVRRRSRTDELILGWDEFPPPDERIVVHYPSPDHQLSQKEELAELAEAIDELPQSQHDALVMRELEGRSYEEIGQPDEPFAGRGGERPVPCTARRQACFRPGRRVASVPRPVRPPGRSRVSRPPARASFAAQAQGTAAQLTAVGGDHAASVVQKAVAVVAAVAVVGGGTAALEQAGVKVPIVHSITAKKDGDSKAAGTAGPGAASFGGAGGAGRDRAGGPGGSGPPGGANDPMVPGGGGAGSPPALASPVSQAPAAGGGPAAPETTAPGTTAPGNSAPASPVSGGGGSNGSQGNQPVSGKVNNGGGSGGGGSSNSTKGGSGQTDSQPLTTPAGEPIPPELPPGVQRQLESGKRTLDDLPPGLKKKLPDGSTSTP